MGVFDYVSVSLGQQLLSVHECLPLSPKDTLHVHLEKHFDKEIQLSYENYTLPAWKRQIVDRESAKKKTIKSGDSIVRDMNYWLDNIGIVRHDYQIYFHQKCIETHLRKIYEHEWAAYERNILQKYNLQTLKQERIIVCPRRFGKTYSVGSFGAVATHCIPNHEIAVFSTGKRAAGKLMVLIIAFLMTIPGFREHCTMHNVENLVLEFGPSDTRKLCCYPGSVGVRFSFV